MGSNTHWHESGETLGVEGEEHASSVVGGNTQNGTFSTG